MRVARKIFLTSSLLIVVLVLLGALSVWAVGRVVAVNREIATRAVPALRFAASLRTTIPSLARLEARSVILRDRGYADLWDETMQTARGELGRIGEVIRTEDERAAWLATVATFADYARLVAQERALLEQGDRQGAMRLVDTEGVEQMQRLASGLDALMDAVDRGVRMARTEAALLERHTWIAVLAGLGASLVLAVGGTALIAFRMTRSLRRLSAATAAVAAGEFDEPIVASDNDEVGELARAFNAMTAQLRQIEATKEEFFATISHELRSPLTSVCEATRLLREEVPGPLNQKQARLAAIIAHSSDRLLGLVNRILEVSRLRAGIATIAREPVEFDRVVRRAVDEVRPQAEEAGIALAYSEVGDGFAVRGDAERLMQAVVNLLANGIRFTPRGGSVGVRLIDVGREIELHVEDTGVGIPADALRTIFEPYRQAHRERGGTGLGLAIVRGVVRAHGGRVTVESTEGKGSRFTILLPRLTA